LNRKMYKVDANGCWLWQGRVSTGGYAFMYWMKTNVVAHRVSYLIHRGPIPRGMLVCHTCDVRHCINPDHLFLGTTKDNAIDMVQKKRHRYGENATCVKLSNRQVMSIRASNVSSNILCKKYGVSGYTIRSIRSRTTWKHLP
jgi:hypothetical protein